MPGEIAFELGEPLRMWVGVPTSADPSGRKKLFDSSAGAADAPTDGQVYGRRGSTASWDPVLSLSGGELTGALTLSGDPTAALQASTKQYVDDAMAAAGVGTFLPLSGGTMLGSLTLAADPTASMQAVTRQYLEAHSTGSDAPNDGRAYGRKSAAWAMVIAASDDVVDGGNF